MFGEGLARVFGGGAGRLGWLECLGEGLARGGLARVCVGGAG